MTDTTTTHTPRWGMVVDVNRCVGCQTCTIACKHANDTLPGVQWRRVLDVETGTFPNVERLFLVTGCQHCAEPPCVPVCPSGATFQRDDGLVVMDYDVCIGCGYCAVACPYQARTIAHEQHWYYGQETVQEQAVAHDDRLRVAQKCSFCIEKIDDAKGRGLTPGIDLEVTPACAAACIAQAIRFGDFKDPDSTVARLVADNRHFQMHAELGTDPQIKYLYETPAIPGREPEPAEADDSAMSDPSNPLVGQRQLFWDWRAAMNWCFGGLSSGFAFMAWIATLTGQASPGALPALHVAAAVFMGFGLFFVFLKIGRKLRALNALNRPQTSWMSRELYVVAVFYPAVLADLIWPHPAIGAVAGLAALAFLICQAKILHMARGIPNLRVPLIPWMIVATGLFEGTGLVALAALAAPGVVATGAPLLLAGIVLAILNAALWMAYRSTAKAQGVGPLSRRVLAAASPWLHAVGHAAPLVLFAVALAAGASVLAALAGVLAVAGGFAWKYLVIVRAAYQQGFALARLPRRGSGIRAAPSAAARTAATAA